MAIAQIVETYADFWKIIYLHFSLIFEVNILSIILIIWDRIHFICSFVAGPEGLGRKTFEF